MPGRTVASGEDISNVFDFSQEALQGLSNPGLDLQTGRIIESVSGSGAGAGSAGAVRRRRLSTVVDVFLVGEAGADWQ